MIVSISGGKIEDSARDRGPSGRGQAFVDFEIRVAL